MSGRQPHSFKHGIRPGDVFAEAIAHHEAHVRVLDLIQELDRNANADAVTLTDAADRVSFLAKYADPSNAGLAVAESMIDIRHAFDEIGNSRQRLFRNIEIAGG